MVEEKFEEKNALHYKESTEAYLSWLLKKSAQITIIKVDSLLH